MSRCALISFVCVPDSTFVEWLRHNDVDRTWHPIVYRNSEPRVVTDGWVRVAPYSIAHCPWETWFWNPEHMHSLAQFATVCVIPPEHVFRPPNDPEQLVEILRACTNDWIWQAQKHDKSHTTPEQEECWRQAWAEKK